MLLGVGKTLHASSKVNSEYSQKSPSSLVPRGVGTGFEARAPRYRLAGNIGEQKLSRLFTEAVNYIKNSWFRNFAVCGRPQIFPAIIWSYYVGIGTSDLNQKAS